MVVRTFTCLTHLTAGAGVFIVLVFFLARVALTSTTLATAAPLASMCIIGKR